jgi:hypothetical protein
MAFKKNNPGCQSQACCGECVNCSLPISGFLYEVISVGCGGCNYSDLLVRPEVTATSFAAGVWTVTHDGVRAFSAGEEVSIGGVTYTIATANNVTNTFTIAIGSNPGIANGTEIVPLPDARSFTAQNCSRFKRFPAAYSVGTPLTTLIEVEWWQTISSKWCDGTPTTCTGLVCTCCDCEAPDPGINDPCTVANDAGCASNECDGSPFPYVTGWVKPTGCDPSDIATTQDERDQVYRTGAVIAQRWTPITVMWVQVEVKPTEVTVTIYNELFVFESLEVCVQKSNLHEDWVYFCGANECCDEEGPGPWTIQVLHETTYTWTVQESCSYVSALMDITLSMLGIDADDNVCGFPTYIVDGAAPTAEAGAVVPKSEYCGLRLMEFVEGNRMNGIVYNELVPVQKKTIPVDWCELEYSPAVLQFTESDLLDYDSELFQFGIAEENSTRAPFITGLNGGIGCPFYVCGGGKPPDQNLDCPTPNYGTAGSIQLIEPLGDVIEDVFTQCGWSDCIATNMFDCASPPMKAPLFSLSKFLDGYLYAQHDSTGTIPTCLAEEVSVSLIDLV